MYSFFDKGCPTKALPIAMPIGVMNKKSLAMID